MEAEAALIYDVSGNIVGMVHCSQRGDLAKQTEPRLLPIDLDREHGHPALRAPLEWQVDLTGPRPVLKPKVAQP